MAKKDNMATTCIGVLAYESCSAWITTGLLELFGVANVVPAGTAGLGTTPRRRFEYHLLGSRELVTASNGVRLPTRAPARRYDAIIVPPLWGTRDDIERRADHGQVDHALLRRLARRASIVASVCSGAVLLAEAGLLDGHRATTCWWLGDWFGRRYPGVELVLDRLVMVDRHCWTAGAGTAYVHLGLELVQRFAGSHVAAGTARALLVERRRGSQSPFIGPPRPPPEGAEAEEVGRAVAYLDAHAAKPLTIATLCRKIRVHERTLARNFRRAMGMSPLAYLQACRVALAKQLLEESDLPLERIVSRCGYEDIASFRKLFARLVGMTPREYRSRFARSD